MTCKIISFPSCNKNVDNAHFDFVINAFNKATNNIKSIAVLLEQDAQSKKILTTKHTAALSIDLKMSLVLIERAEAALNVLMHNNENSTNGFYVSQEIAL